MFSDTIGTDDNIGIDVSSDMQLESVARYQREKAKMFSKPTRRDLMRISGLATLGSMGLLRNPAGTKAAVRQESVEIRASGYVESQQQLTQTVAVLERYEELNPDVSIRPEFSDYSSYTTKLATEIAGGNAPDLMSMTTRLQSEYSERGVIRPLDEFVPDVIDLSDYAQGTVEANRFDGSLYGIPNDTISTTLIYNTVMFEEAGVSVPPDMWTWEAYMQTANELSEALGEGVYGTEDAGGSYTAFDMFLRGRGKDFYGAEGGVGFGEEDLAAWLAFWQEMRESGGCPPGEIQALSSDEPSRTLLITGQAAMLAQLTDSYVGLQTLTEAELGLHLLPNGFEGEELDQHHYIYAGNSSSISADTEYADTVIDIIRFMTTDPEGVAIFYRGSGLIPPSDSARKLLREEASPAEARVVDYLESIIGNEGHPRHRAIPGITDILSRMNEEVAFNRLSVEAAVEQFFQEVEQTTR